jgi:hypothetical protein
MRRWALLGALVVACGDGAPGVTGAVGPVGPAGDAGPAGALLDAGASVASTGPCTAPCHTFGGVVDRWRASAHEHPTESVVPAGVCGNCHAIDGVPRRVASATPDIAKGHLESTSATGVLSESAYTGSSTRGQVHCQTCHDTAQDPHVVGRYEAGQWPLRVPAGPNDTVLLETTPSGTVATGQPLAYGSANVCVFCHKSRKDVTLYIAATGNVLSTRWGPHDGPQADLYSGKGGYPFRGQTYGGSTHGSLANACVTCHMGLDERGIPDHGLRPTVAFCRTCHTAYTGIDFDVQGGQTLVRSALHELQAALNAQGYLTRSTAAPYAALTSTELADGQFALDTPRPATVDGPTAGALYDYLLVARGKDLGVHNPTYAKQLLWDAIEQIESMPPTSLPARP